MTHEWLVIVSVDGLSTVHTVPNDGWISDSDLEEHTVLQIGKDRYR